MYGLVGTLAQSTILLVGILGKFLRKEERSFFFNSVEVRSTEFAVLHSSFSLKYLKRENQFFVANSNSSNLFAVCQSVSQ